MYKTPPGVRVAPIADESHFLRQAKRGGPADTVVAAQDFKCVQAQFALHCAAAT